MASTTTFKCDRCGRDNLPEADSRQRPLKRNAGYSISVYSYAQPGKEFDLCGSCTERFYQALALWMASKDKDA